MTEPFPTNQAATEVNKVIKTIEEICVPIAENAIIAACPEMGWPVVKQITESIETGIANYVTKWEELGATFLVIDVQEAHEQGTLTDDYSAIIAAQKTGNQEAVHNAIIAYANAHSAAIHADGSARPI